MPSPFPGMNPYLEQKAIWPSFHNHFNLCCLEHLSPQLDPRFYIQSEQRLYIHEPSGEERLQRVADIGVSHPSPSATGSIASLLRAPAVVTLPDTIGFERVPYLAIRDRRGRHVVTVIETLSPTNKASGPDRLQYLIKRRELLHSQANFVEIDLLRGGTHMPSDDFPECDYCVLVSRAIDRPQAGVWPWRLRETMPKVPIPIVRDIPEIALNLKVVLDLVYDRGAYRNYLFDEAPEPLLSPDDAAWAAQFVPSTI